MDIFRRLHRIPLPEFMILLLGADALFVVLHLFHHYSSHFSDSGFSLALDRSFSEVFQYVKEYWIIVLFLWLGTVKSRAHWAWAVVFGYLLLDDSFSVHERVGEWLSVRFGFGSYLMLRPRDLGEITVSAVVGSALLSIIAAAYYRGDAAFRRTSRRMLLLFVLLAFFGVVVDMIHIVVDQVPHVGILAGLLEDSGEMVVMSLICWYVLVLLTQARKVVTEKELTIG